MRVALVGAEHWHAGFYLGSFRRAGARIVGVADVRGEAARRLAAEAGCEAFDDHRRMIDRTRPDFIMATARHSEMSKLALELLRFGIPMGFEKPMGLNAGQIGPVVEEVERRKAFVAVPLVNRYSLLWQELEGLAGAGREGIRSHAHFRVINGVPGRYPDLGVGWMLDPAVSGGGCLINLGVHAADAFLSFARSAAVKVLSAAVTRRVHHLPIEEMGAALLVSPAGVIGTIEAGYSYATREAGGDFEWRVATANGYLVDRGDTLLVATLDDGQTRVLPNLSQKERYEHFGEDTLDRLKNGRAPIATVEDCYRAVRLLDEIYSRAVTSG